MYKIIGADQKEYGPVSTEQLRQWISEGRVNGQTMVQLEGQHAWRMLSSVSELAPLISVRASAIHPAGAEQTGGEEVPLEAAKVQTYLIPAIVITLCCCVPGGIVAIIYATQTSTKLQAGDVRGALEASNKAKTWCWVSGVVGIIIGIAYLILMRSLGEGSLLPPR